MVQNAYPNRADNNTNIIYADYSEIKTSYLLPYWLIVLFKNTPEKLTNLLSWTLAINRAVIWIKLTPHSTEGFHEVSLQVLIRPASEAELAPTKVWWNTETMEKEVDLPGTTEALASRYKLGLEKVMSQHTTTSMSLFFHFPVLAVISALTSY